MKTKVLKAKDIKRQWHLVDVSGEVLGRTMTKVAEFLIGKNKPTYSPNLDGGDYVVIINASKVAVTGKKLTDKIYRHHTGFPGGFREIAMQDVMKKDPRKIIEKAVAGMLPKNKLRAPRLKRLKIFAGETHPYQNQLEKAEE